MDFLKKFLFDGFKQGDYTYGTVHVFSIMFLMSIVVISIILLRGKDKALINRIMKIVAIFTLVVYVTRHTVNAIDSGKYLYNLWPFYICAVNTVFLCIWIIFDLKFMKDFFIITGMFGAVLMFVVPDGIFVDKYMTINIFDSLLSHFTIFYIPLVLLFTRTYELDIKRLWQVLLGLGLTVFNVEVLQRVLFDRNEDYLFLRGELPFTIDGVPQFIIMIISTVLAVYMIYFLNYLLCGKLKQLKEDLKLN